MPGPLRHSLERMLPILKAEEELQLCSLVAVGTGSVRQQDAREWRNARLKQSGVEPVRRPASWREHIANLTSRGFRVVVDGETVGGSS